MVRGMVTQVHRFTVPCFVCGKLVHRFKRARAGVQITCKDDLCRQAERRHRSTIVAWRKLQDSIGATLKADMDLGKLNEDQRLEFMRLAMRREQMIRDVCAEERKNGIIAGVGRRDDGDAGGGGNAKASGATGGAGDAAMVYPGGAGGGESSKGE